MYLIKTSKDNEKLYGLLILILTSITTYSLTRILDLATLESVIEGHWQILDIPALVSDPIQSLLYLHAQPPLLNALVFLAHKIGGSPYDNLILFNSFFIGIISAIIFKILVINRCSIGVASFFSILYSIFPSTLLNVAYPFYPCLTALGYALLLYSFVKVKLDFKRSLIIFGIACILLSLTRGSFTLVHIIFFIILFLVYARKVVTNKKSLAMILSLVLILSAVVPIKNFIFYDFFGTSSWSSLNLAKGLGIPNETRYFINAEEISELYPNLQCQNSYHIQDTIAFKSSGSPNYNSCLVLEYSKLIKSKKLAGYSARSHAIGFIRNSVEYFSPSDKFRFLSNRAQITSYANVVNLLQLTVPITDIVNSFGFSTERLVEIRLLPIVIIILATFMAVSHRNSFLSVCIIMILLHFASHTLSDGSESKRFVFDIEFIFFILLGYLISVFRSKPIKVNHI